MDQVALSPSLIFIKFTVKNLFMHSNLYHRRAETQQKTKWNKWMAGVLGEQQIQKRWWFVYSCIYLPLNPGKLIYISRWIFI